MADVHAELSEIFSKYKISKWMSKPVERKYAFEIPEVPAEAQYMKVIYSYNRKWFCVGMKETCVSD